VVHAAFLAEALTAAGWDVTLYALDKDGGGFFRDVRARLRLVPAGPAPSTTAELVRQRTFELSRYLASAPRHDVYHAEDCLTASGLLDFRSRAPFVQLVRTVHHVEGFTDPYLARCQERSIREATLRLWSAASSHLRAPSASEPCAFRTGCPSPVSRNETRRIGAPAAHRPGRRPGPPSAASNRERTRSERCSLRGLARCRALGW
jgi:hypothetical protein